MHYLAEDPWPLAGALAALGVIFLIALRVTQRGAYLVRGLVCLALAGAVVGIEQLWVTDAERIEWVVKDLARAVRDSDADAAVACLAPDVEVAMGDDVGAAGGALDIERFRTTLADLHFDLLHVSNLRTEAFPRSQTGRATFDVTATGRTTGVAFLHRLPRTFQLRISGDSSPRISASLLPRPVTPIKSLTTEVESLRLIKISSAFAAWEARERAFAKSAKVMRSLSVSNQKNSPSPAFPVT